MKLRIFITKNIIKQSMNCGINVPLCDAKFGQNCAIGVAIVKLFGMKSWVATDEIRIYAKNYNPGINPIYLIPLPEIASDFISAFDDLIPEDRIKMIPISFDIDIPEELVEKLGLSYMHKIIEIEPQLELV